MENEEDNISSKEMRQLLIKLGFSDVACYTCRFFNREAKNLYGTCDHPLSVTIKNISDTVRESQGGHSLPLFPIVTTVVENKDTNEKENLTIPAIVASEVGITAGAVKWPEYYDPQQILICTLHEKQTDEIISH